MNNLEMIQNLAAVCGALNQIDVKGKHNMKNLFGSIEILEAIIAHLQNAQQPEAHKEEQK